MQLYRFRANAIVFVTSLTKTYLQRANTIPQLRVTALFFVCFSACEITALKQKPILYNEEIFNLEKKETKKKKNNVT